MFYKSLFVMLLTMLLAACQSTKEPGFELTGATLEFSKERQVVIRGVRENGNLKHPASLSREIYNFKCMETFGETSAEQRAEIFFTAAKEESFAIKSQFQTIPRNRGSLSRRINKKLAPTTGCKGGIKFERITTDKSEILLFAAKNNLLKDLIDMGKK